MSNQPIDTATPPDPEASRQLPATASSTAHAVDDVLSLEPSQTAEQHPSIEVTEALIGSAQENFLLHEFEAALAPARLAAEWADALLPPEDIRRMQAHHVAGAVLAATGASEEARTEYQLCLEPFFAQVKRAIGVHAKTTDPQYFFLDREVTQLFAMLEKFAVLPAPREIDLPPLLTDSESISRYIRHFHSAQRFGFSGGILRLLEEHAFEIFETIPGASRELQPRWHQRETGSGPQNSAVRSIAAAVRQARPSKLPTSPILLDQLGLTAEDVLTICRSSAVQWSMDKLRAALIEQAPTTRIKSLKEYGGTAGFAIGLGIEREFKARIDEISGEQGGSITKTAALLELEPAVLRQAYPVLAARCPAPEGKTATAPVRAPAEIESLEPVPAAVCDPAVALQLIRSPGINWNIKKLHAALAAHFKTFIPSLNRIGGEAGFAHAVGIGDALKEKIEEQFRASSGSTKTAAAFFSINDQTMRRLYQKLCEISGQPRNLTDIAVPSGTLLPQLRAALGQLRQGDATENTEKATLRDFLLKKFAAIPGQTPPGVGELSAAVEDWCQAPDGHGIRWNLAKIVEAVKEILPHVHKPLFSTADVIWGLDLHGSVSAEIERRSADHAGVATHIGMTFGWQNKGAASNLNEVRERLQLLQQAEQRWTRRADEIADDAAQAAPVEAPRLLSASDPENVARLAVLEKLRRSSEEPLETVRGRVLTDLASPEVDWNFAKYIQHKQPELAWLVNRGFDAMVKCLRIEVETRAKIAERFVAYNGVTGPVCEEFGITESSFRNLHRKLGLDLATIEIPRGNLLSTFNVNRDEVLAQQQTTGWKHLAQLKGELTARMQRERANGGRPVLQEKSISHSDIICGLDIGDTVKAVVAERRGIYRDSLNLLGDSFGWAKGNARKIMSDILERNQPLVGARWPAEMTALETQLHAARPSAPSLTNQSDWLTQAGEKYRLLRESAPPLPASALKLPQLSDIAAPGIRYLSGSATTTPPKGGLVFRPWHYDWGADERAISADQQPQFKLMRDTMLGMQKRDPAIDYFWVEYAPGYNSDARCIPCCNLAGISGEDRAARAVTRLELNRSGRITSTALPHAALEFVTPVMQAMLTDAGYRPARSASAFRESIERTEESVARILHVFTETAAGRPEAFYRWVARDLSAAVLAVRACNGAVPRDLGARVEGPGDRGPSALELFFELNSPRSHLLFDRAQSVIAATPATSAAHCKALVDAIVKSDQFCYLFGDFTTILNETPSLYRLLDAGHSPAIEAIQSLARELQRIERGFRVAAAAPTEEIILDEPPRVDAPALTPQPIEQPELLKAKATTPEPVEAFTSPVDLQRELDEAASNPQEALEALDAHLAECAGEISQHAEQVAHALRLGLALFGDPEQPEVPAGIDRSRLVQSYGQLYQLLVAANALDSKSDILGSDESVSDLLMLSGVLFDEGVSENFSAIHQACFHEMVGDAFARPLMQDLPMALDELTQAYDRYRALGESTDADQLRLETKMAALDPANELVARAQSTRGIINQLRAIAEFDDAAQAQREKLIRALSGIDAAHREVLGWQAEREIARSFEELRGAARTAQHNPARFDEHLTRAASLIDSFNETFCAGNDTRGFLKSFNELHQAVAPQLLAGRSAELSRHIQSGAAEISDIADRLFGIASDLVKLTASGSIEVTSALTVAAQLPRLTQDLSLRHTLRPEIELARDIGRGGTPKLHVNLHKRMREQVSQLCDGLTRITGATNQTDIRRIKSLADEVQHSVDSVTGDQAKQAELLKLSFVHSALILTERLQRKIPLLLDTEAQQMERRQLTEQLQTFAETAAHLGAIAASARNSSSAPTTEVMHEFLGDLLSHEPLRAPKQAARHYETALEIAAHLPTGHSIVPRIEEKLLQIDPANELVAARRRTAEVSARFHSFGSADPLHNPEFQAAIHSMLEMFPEHQGARRLAEGLEIAERSERLKLELATRDPREIAHEVELLRQRAASLVDETTGSALRSAVAASLRQVDELLSARQLEWSVSALCEKVRLVEIDSADFQLHAAALEKQIESSLQSGALTGDTAAKYRLQLEHSGRELEKLDTITEEISLAKHYRLTIPRPQGGMQKRLFKAASDLLTEIAQASPSTTPVQLCTRRMQIFTTLRQQYAEASAQQEHRAFAENSFIRGAHDLAVRLLRKARVQ